jgi:PAS domain S-box-containing protein
MKRSRLSLATVVIGIIVIIVSAALAVAGTIAYHSYNTQKWTEFNNAVDLEAERLVIALAPAIWNLEHPQIQKVMESLMKDPQYAGITVDIGNRQLTLGRDKSGASVSMATSPQLDEHQVRHRPVIYAEERIGELTLYPTSARLEADLKQALFFFIALALLLDLLISFALYLSLLHLVLKPLRRVERYASEVALGKISTPEYSQLELFGELNRLTAAIDTMLRQLGQRNVELTKSSERFKTVIRLLPVPLILYDDNSNNVYLNECFVATFGYTLDDIPDASRWFEQAYPEPIYRAEVFATWRQEIADAQAERRAIRALQYRIQCRNGSTKYAEVGGIVSNDINIAVLADVTDRMLAEEELRRYREHLEEVVANRTIELVATNRRLEETQFAIDHAGIGIALIDPESGKIQYVNDQACTLFGRSRESLLQTHVTDISDDFTYEHSQALVVDLVAHGYTRLETSVQQADGKRLPIEVSLYFQPPSPEAVAGRYYAFVTDITPRKAVEATLIEAKQAAELAANTRSAFLANMSHEIRTPMNAIIGMSELALNGPLEAKQRNFIEKAHRSAVSLLGIINDILDFSKVEAGRLDIERIDFALDPIFENLTNIVAYSADKKDLELIFDLPPELPDRLIGDPMRLSQILINLLSNAIKFTETGTVTLACRIMKERDTGHTRLNFIVSDTGMGMTTAQVNALFSPFQQGDNSISRRYGGTGLGLAISKNLAELMGGQIAVSSKLGRGSIFSVSIPFLLPENGTCKTQLPEAFDHQLAIIVTPLAETRANLCRMFEALGMLAKGVETAADALAQCSGTSMPHLLLSTVNLPDRSGIDLIHELAESATTPRMLLIATPKELETLQHDSDDIPALSIIPAPLRPATLLAVLGGKASSDSCQPTEYRTPQLRLDGLHILLVEDNELNQELAQEILEVRGATVTLAENGRVALDRLTEQPFDCVLMDVQMPVLDGLTATRIIRADVRWKTLPIIAMTAGVTPGECDQTRLAGMDAHVAKPIEVKLLIETITRLTAPVSGESGRPVDKQSGQTRAVHLDTAYGLSVVNGNQQIFTRLLNMLLTQSDEKIVRLEQLCRAGKHVDAASLAHNIKGSCASVGATLLANVMEQIEQACRTMAEPSTLAAQADAATAIWRATARACRRHLGQPVDSAVPSNANVLLDILGQLREFLLDDDVAAVATASQLVDTVIPETRRMEYIGLIKKVKAYNFEAALIDLERLLDELTGSTESGEPA